MTKDELLKLLDRYPNDTQIIMDPAKYDHIAHEPEFRFSIAYKSMVVLTNTGVKEIPKGSKVLCISKVVSFHEKL